MWNSFENNWIVIRIASRFSKRAQDLNFSCFWALKYVGNFIGSNPFEPEPDQNRGPVQSSGICLNRTIGPVHGSQKTLENQTEPNFSITRWNMTMSFMGLLHPGGRDLSLGIKCSLVFLTLYSSQLTWNNEFFLQSIAFCLIRMIWLAGQNLWYKSVHQTLYLRKSAYIVCIVK